MIRSATVRRILPAAGLLLGLLVSLPAHAQFAQAADKVRDAVVTVQVTKEKRMGTGFVISPDGYILTNKHVLGGATEATVKLANGDGLTAKVVPTESLDDRDLLVLKIERQHLPTVQFASSAKLKQGDEVAAIGAPFGLSDTLTKGVVSSVGREIEGKKYIQIDAALNQGNSGGPIINEQGQVVGVATKAALKAENMGFAIPSDDAMAFLREANLTFAATLDAQPAGAPEGEPGGPPAGGPVAAAPAVPAAPPVPRGCPLGDPWATLVAAALIAFLVALITSLVVAKSATRRAAQTYMPGPGYQSTPQSYSQAPGWGTAAPQAPHPPAPVQPAAPPQEDLSDIDIELR